jgi:hypothetical protein
MVNPSPLGSVTLIVSRKHLGMVRLKMDFPLEVVVFSDVDALVEIELPLEDVDAVELLVDCVSPVD